MYVVPFFFTISIDILSSLISIFFYKRSCHMVQANLELMISPALAYQMQGLLVCNITSLRNICLLPYLSVFTFSSLSVLL